MNGAFLGFWVLLRGSVNMEGTSFAGLPLMFVHRAWVTQLCPSQDTPVGRRSAGALSAYPSGSLLGST